MEFNPLIPISFTLLVSFLFAEVAKHFKYPRVLGQIVAGIVVGLPVFDALMSEKALSDIAFLSKMGVIFLFLLIGMEINLAHLKAEKKRTSVVGLLTIVVPFLFGYFTAQILGYTNFTALILGMCFSVSSWTTNTQIFIEMKLMEKGLAKVIFGAAMLAELFAVLFLAFLLPIIEGDLQQIATIPVKIILFMGVIWGLTKLMPFFITHIEKDESRVAEVSLMIMFGLLVAVLSIQLGLGEIIGAFLAGLIIQLSSKHQCTDACGDQTLTHQRHRKFFIKNVGTFKVMTLSFVIPFLFIAMGLYFDLGSIAEHPFTMGLVLLAAVAGKFGGAILAQPWTHFTGPQTSIVAWGMNARGTLELVIAEIALTHGLLEPELYAALVLMVVLTSLAFPIVLKHIIKKHPRAMDLRPL